MDAPLKHIAFIMDGNGRWAQQRGLARTEGHKVGAQRVFDVAQRAFKHWNIPYVTLYAFSTENWKRPAYEIHFIFKLLGTYLKRKRSLFFENRIRFNTIGDLTRLPEKVQSVILELKDQTKVFDGHTLTIALNYGAREEVLFAISQLLVTKDQPVTWENLEKHLYTAGMPDPDLIVRTSGEQRLSNYLLLQAAYSEFYFPEVHWPDFSEEAFDKAIEVYQQRTRRFGGIA